MFSILFSFAGNQGPSQAQFEAQAAAGLNVQLEYVDSSTIKCSSKSGSTIDVITPDLNIVSVSTSGITKTVAGSTSTLYYVYLDSTGMVFSTTAPDTSYTNMKTLTSNKLLLGYMGCSGSNAIAGTHNVYSFWNEPQRSYTQSTTTINSASLALNGFVLPPGKSVTVGWSGSVTRSTTFAKSILYTGTRYLSDSLSTSVLGSVSTGNRWWDWYYSVCSYSIDITLSLSNSTISSGVTNTNIFLSGSSSSWIGSCGGEILSSWVSSSSWSSVSGTITLTRPSS